MKHVDYDEVSKTYDSRYKYGIVEGVEKAVRDLALRIPVTSVLEVGCGTGAYLGLFEKDVSIYGLDYSAGMLSKARERNASAALTRGTAFHIPFASSAFDLVTCIHANHFFDDNRAFIKEAKRVLRRDSALAIINMDPHTDQDKWYLYKYFPDTFNMDINRYPSGNQVLGWMDQAGFIKCECYPVHRFVNSYQGREIYDDPIFYRHGTSQLSLLSEKQWEKGVSMIKNKIDEAESKGRKVAFEVDITLYMSVGYTE